MSASTILCCKRYHCSRTVRKIIYAVLIVSAAIVIFTVSIRYKSWLGHPIQVEDTKEGAIDPVNVTSSHHTALLDKPFDTLDQYCASRISKVNPHNFDIIMTGEHVCSQSDPFLVIVVPSVHSHVDTRQAIRETWGSVSRSEIWADGQDSSNIRLVFLFGIQPGVDSYPHLEKESREYKDIAQENFVDSYRNLSIKTVFAMRWVAKFCPRAKYVLKTDEDTFVHVPRLLAFILGVNSKNLIIGRKTILGVRRDTGKWRVDRKMFPFESYPPFIQGQSYVLPGQSAPKLFSLSEYFPLIPVEDVFVTGILAHCAGMRHLKQTMNYRFGLTGYRHIHRCFFHENFRRITVAGVRKGDLLETWTALKNGTCFL